MRPRHRGDWFARTVFLLILAAGVVMGAVMPPIQPPDEDAHLLRLMMLTDGQIFPRKVQGVVSARVPDSLSAYVAAGSEMRGHSEQRYDATRWRADAFAEPAAEPASWMVFNMQSASPLVYLPQLAGLLAAKSLAWVAGVGLSWQAQLYAGRIGNLLVFAVCILIALRLLPVLRQFVAGFALVPMVVHQAASLSYDTTPILAALALLTVVLRAQAAGRPPSSREQAVLIVAAFFLGHAKLVYAPLLVVLAGLRWPSGLRGFAWFWGVPLGVCIAGALLSSAVFGPPDDARLNAGMAAQQTWLMQHVTEIPGLLARTLALHGASYAASAVGVLGSLDTRLPNGLIVLIWLLLLAAIAVDARRRHAGSFGRLAALSVPGCLAASFLIFIALYITWTSTGAATVDGVQGRYFLPVLPGLALAGWMLARIVLAGGGTSEADAPRAALLAAHAAVLVAAISAAVARYWLTG